MLTTLSRFIERYFKTDDRSTPLSLHQKHLAVAALLVEIAIADHHFSEQEMQKLSIILKTKFSLTNEEMEDLIGIAKNETDQATSLHQFTSLINQHCDQNEKFAFMKAMWEIAYADGDLNKYEDYTIRKIADLIYVPHSEFIRAKQLVKAQI